MKELKVKEGREQKLLHSDYVYELTIDNIKIPLVCPISLKTQGTNIYAEVNIDLSKYNLIRKGITITFRKKE